MIALLLLLGCAGKDSDSLPLDSNLLLDADGDGYHQADDCDDSDPDVHPEAIEYCDGIDNNCDGVTDGADAADAQTQYTDADGDGYGDDAKVTTSCSEVGVTSVGDCDDSDAGVHPGATEICDDGVDQNCDGCTSECPTAFTPPEWADATASNTGEDLGTGHYLSGIGDITGDTTTDFCVGSPWDNGAGDLSGKIYLVAGPPDGRAQLEDSYASITGAEDSQLGPCSLMVDWDGDELNEVLAGAPTYMVRGAVYLFLSPVTTGERSTGDADGTIVTPNLGELLGSRVGSGSTLLGEDTTSPVVMGAPGALDGGQVYIFASLPEGTVPITDVDYQLWGPAEHTSGADFVADVDVNGDGFDDIVVSGQPWDSAAGSYAGQAFVVYGPIAASLSLADSDLVVAGAKLGVGFGKSVAGTDDLDGDGQVDLVIGEEGGAAGGDNIGSVYVFHTTGDSSIAADDATAILRGSDDVPFTWIGQATVDMNGDDYLDLLVGSLLTDIGDQPDAGRVLAYAGPLNGTYTPDCASATLDGTEADGNSGIVANLGDLTGDGLDDLGIGVPGAHITADTAGGVYLFAGGSW